MNFIHDITRKPWTASQGAIDDLQDSVATSQPAAKLGLKMFFAVATVLFSLLSVAYAERMVVAQWRPLPESWLMWLNVGSLVLCSVAFQWARVSARRDEIDGVKGGLMAGGALTFIFLLGQLLAWQQLVEAGYFANTNPANAFFYLITGTHALHLLGGLVAWGRTTIKLLSGSEIASIRTSVELCAVYWHFLLIIWVILFGLMLST